MLMPMPAPTPINTHTRDPTHLHAAHCLCELARLAVQVWPLCDDAARPLQLGLLGHRVVAQVYRLGLQNGEVAYGMGKWMYCGWMAMWLGG
jgi:hypothetical protein